MQKYPYELAHSTNMQGGICANKDLNFSQMNCEYPQI